MPRRLTWLLLLLFGLAASDVSAQRPGTVVQLPTFSSFSVSTSVLVPDRGSGYLGGVKRAADGRTESGVPLLPLRPFRNSAIGSERSATGARVSAFVHDFEAMDQQLLSQPSRNRPAVAAAGNTHARAPAVGPSWSLAASVDASRRAVASVAEARAQHAAEQTARRDESPSLIARAERAAAEGNPGAARVYCQMAARRASGSTQPARLAEK